MAYFQRTLFSFAGQAQVDRLQDFLGKLNSKALKTSEYACDYHFLHSSYAEQIHMNIQIKLLSLINQQARTKLNRLE